MKSSTFFLELLPKLEDGYRSVISAVEAGGITTIADLEFPIFEEELELNMARTILDIEDGGSQFTTFAVPSSRMYGAKNGSHGAAIANIKKVAKEVRIIYYKIRLSEFYLFHILGVITFLLY